MELMAKVVGMNTSDGLVNLNAVDKASSMYNLKVNSIDAQAIKLGHTYIFNYDIVDGLERKSYNVVSFTEITELDFSLADEALRAFYPGAPISAKDAQEEVNKYIELIDNDIIKEITKYLINKYHDKFFIYPAASKMHHAYVGGLAYHSIGMLNLADGFLKNYPYLKKDYLYAGIMLHDIGKALELSGVVNTEYSLKGQLVGHLVLGAMEIELAAKELGYADCKEALYLEHMLVSHHGMPQFGSAKKPATAEALALWYIDTIDSKFRVLGEELAKTKEETYTDSIGVLDRTKIYKI